MATMLEVAKEEAERLKLILSQNEDYQKLQHVQRVIDTYESFEDMKTSGLSPASKAPSQTLTFRTKPKAFLAAYGSKVAAVNKVVSEHFSKTGQRASSGELLPIVQAAGVKMSGAVPAKTLSSFLTNSKSFNNVKGLGYGLVEWGNGPGPNARPDIFHDFADILGSTNNSGAGDDRS